MAILPYNDKHWSNFFQIVERPEVLKDPRYSTLNARSLHINDMYAMVEALARSTSQPIDAHLMITDADRNAAAYVEAGAASVTFHVEAAAAPIRLAREIRRQGARASMALKPATPIDPYEDLLAELDMVLIMTVEPGFGGQKFIPAALISKTLMKSISSSLRGSRAG
jgi:ribulose-phosphate 3-epimerase